MTGRGVQHCRMGSRRLVASVMVASCTALFAACGGGSSTIARADYVKRANAICKKYNAQTKAIAPKSEAELKPAIHKGVQIIAKETAELRALPKPDSSADKYAKLYDAVDQEFATLDSKSLKE